MSAPNLTDVYDINAAHAQAVAIAEALGLPGAPELPETVKAG